MVVWRWSSDDLVRVDSSMNVITSTLVHPQINPIHSAYRRHDKEKRREYQQQVHEVENASFSYSLNFYYYWWNG